MDTRAFAAAGLYDPTAPNAPERLALLEWLADRGLTVEQMVRAARQGPLGGLAADLVLRGGSLLTLRDLAERLGTTPAQLETIRFAVGLPPIPEDEPRFSEEDIQTFAAFSVGVSLFGETETLRFGRVLGSSLARIAEAVVSLYLVNVEGPLREQGGSERALAEANLRAIESLGSVAMVMRGILLAHVETAIRRSREARRFPSVDTAHVTIGFVDLVGFTTLSRRLSTHDLAAVVERFEDTAHDVATARDGRVVKLIGDEVMFVTRDAAAACDIALTLLERFADDADVTPRGGLATGDPLARGGDYYGPIVNLAARLAELAVPNELLVTTEVAAEVRAAALHFDPAGKRMLRGFDEPVTLLTVTRARGTPG